jgi:putative peptidoglycan lipid II flippase
MSEPAGRPAEVHLARSTAAMTALTAVSRLTGFVRIVVVAAVLGTTFLGNTYQSANTVPNLLFELFAAGVLQAVLIPSLVESLDRGDRREAQHVAGSVLGLTATGLAVLATLGMLFAPWIMRGLVSGVADPEIREAQVRLGVFFLWFFLPQVVLYAAGMIATGVLNAHGRFALPVLAPAVNNVVVTASYGLFWYMRDGAAPSLDLTLAQKVVLAGGTTLGVLAFCAVPVVAVLRSGFSLRPRLDHRHPQVRRIGRLGVWAALFVAMTQVLLTVVLVLANRVEGGVIAYQVAFTFFLLPHALFALPVLTALFPHLSRQAQARDWAGYARSIERGLRAIAFFTLPASAAFVALAGPMTRSVVFGASDPEQVARVVVGLAPGLVGYGALLFLGRAFAALDDTRTPALVNAGVAVAGVVLMVTFFGLAPSDQQVPAVGLAHSIVYLAGAGVLYARLVRTLPASPRPARSLAMSAAAAGVADLVVWAGGQLLDPPDRAGAVVQVAVLGAAGAVSYLALQNLPGGTRPTTVLALVRGSRDG